MKSTQTVLLVEDEPHTRLLLEYLLIELGYACVAVEGERGALDVLEREAVSIVLADRHAGDVDGLALCALVRREYPHVDAPFVLMSASRDPRTPGAPLAPDAFLRKPFDVETLRSCLASVRSICALRPRPAPPFTFARSPRAANE